MSRILITTLMLCLIGGQSLAQKSNTAATSFTAYRQLGEVKAWSFIAKDSSIGQLFSTVKQRTDINGVAGYEIDQNLQLDYNKIGSERTVLISGNHYVSEQGYYLGDKTEITVNGERENLELERDGNTLEGFYTRGGNKIESEIEFKSNGFAADLLYLDMYENFFAMHDFKEGDTITDSVFVPQTMLVDRLTAVVEVFGLISLYNQVKDSVFVIKLIHPQSVVLYFNKRKQLVKADYLDRQMKAYLDIIRTLPPEALTKPQFSFSRFIGLVPLYAVYLLFGAVILVFFAGADIYRQNLYLFLVAGGLSFIVAVFTQVPIQTYLGKNFYLTNVNNGGSPYFWAVIPSLPAGLIQEFLKLAVIVSVTKFIKTDKNKLLYYGAAIGAGFGIVEAAYIVSQFLNIEMWSMNLVERGFQILFHATSGVILAAAWNSSDFRKRVTFIVLVILANTWIRYLPVFVQKSVIEPQLLYILQPIVPIIMMIYCVWLFKRRDIRR